MQKNRFSTAENRFWIDPQLILIPTFFKTTQTYSISPYSWKHQEGNSLAWWEAVEFQRISHWRISKVAGKASQICCQISFRHCPLFLLARGRARKTTDPHLLSGAYLSLRGCVNTASWLPLADSASFTQPLRYKFPETSEYTTMLKFRAYMHCVLCSSITSNSWVRRAQ